MSEESQDLTYQYKFAQFMELEFVDSRLKIVTVKTNLLSKGLNTKEASFTLDQKQEELLDAILGKVTNRSSEVDGVDQTSDSSRPKLQTPKLKSPLKDYLTKLKYKPTPLLSLFPSTFPPVVDPKDLWHCKMLEQWLSNPYVHKNYALLLINDFKPKTPPIELKPQEGAAGAKPKTVNKGQESADVFDRKATLTKGIRSKEISCICLDISERFASNYHKTSNSELFEYAYNMIGDTFLCNGIMTDSTQKSMSFTFLQFFYSMLDCYPRFKNYCYSRLAQVEAKLDVGGPWTDLFQAETDLIRLWKPIQVGEITLSSSQELLRDMAMLLLLEFDITRDIFLATVNLLEYLCSGSQRFYFLGLFLGDFYHEKIFGSPQGRDEEKRKNYYELAEKSGHIEDKIVFHARARLSVVYQSFFEVYTRQSVSTATTPRLTEAQLNEFYRRIVDINQYLLQENHPIALGFFATHYTKCYDIVLDSAEKKSRPATKDSVEEILARRKQSLNKAAEYLRALFILGDTVYLDLYYRLLRFLKYDEIFFVAARLVGSGTEENLFVPMAYCKEKGIGGGGVNYKFALQTYKNAIVSYSREKDLFKVGLVLYRVALIFSKGGQIDRAKPLFAKALVYVLFSGAKHDDKRFLVHLANCLEQVEFPDKDTVIKKIFEGAYSMYPKNPREFILHYETELKIKFKFLTQHSLTKTDVNLIAVDPVLVDSFRTERLLIEAGRISSKTITQIIKEMKLFIKQQYLMHLKENNQMLHEDINTFVMENYLLDVELLTQFRNGASFIEDNVDLDNIDLDVPLKHIRLEEDAEADEKFRQIESLVEGKTKDENFEQETEFDVLFDDLLKKNENLKAMKLLADTVRPFEGLNNVDETIFFNAHVKVGRFEKNNQLCRIFELKLQKKKKELIEFTEKMDFMLTNHPYLLNYLGVKSVKSNDGLFHINLYSEYFDKFGGNMTGIYLNRNNIPIDKMHEISYQVIHLIRSFHVVGKVVGFINSIFLAQTPDLDIHFVLPFFLPFFNNMKVFVDAHWKNPNLMRHMPPEWVNSKLNVNCLGHYFPVFSPQMENKDSEVYKHWSQYRAGDIWSLGIFLYELFEGKPFYKFKHQDEQVFETIKDLGKMEVLLQQNLKSLNKETPKFVNNLIRACLQYRESDRPNIEEVVSIYEEILYNQIYRLPPMTMSHFTKQMYMNVYYDMNRNKAEPYLKIDASREVRMILPKGYVYQGKCDPRLPHGEGQIFLGDSLVLVCLNFQHGIITTECSINISKSDRLHVEFTSSVEDPTRPKEVNKAGTFPHIVRIISNLDGSTQTLGQQHSEYFVPNSWLPNPKVLLGIFNQLLSSQKKHDRPNKQGGDPKPNKRGILSRFSRYPWSNNEKVYNCNLVNNQAPVVHKESGEPDDVRAPTTRGFTLGAPSYFDRLKTLFEGYLMLVKNNSQTFDSKLQLDASASMVANLFEQFKERLPANNTQATDPYTTEDCYTIILEPFGNMLRVNKVVQRSLGKTDTVVRAEVRPWKGIYFTPLESGLCYETKAFLPLVDNTKLFHCRIQNFAVCERDSPIFNFRELHHLLKDARFSRAWVSVFETKVKQFHGEISEDGPVKGRLFVDDNSYMDIDRSDSGAFKAIVINSKTGVQYEGALENMRKNGFGELSHHTKKVYAGQFKDGQPHGKGMCFDETRDKETVIFRGIFKAGMKKYGTSVIYRKKPGGGPITEGSAAFSLEEMSLEPGQSSLNSLVPKNKASAARVPKTGSSQELSAEQEDRVEYFGLFVPVGTDQSTPNAESDDSLLKFVERTKTQGCFLVIGSKRKKRSFPIYFGKFIEQAEIQLKGPIKVDYDRGSYFFGKYSDQSERVGQGVRVYEDGKKLIGKWRGEFCQGYLQHVGNSPEKFCEGYFRVNEVEQKVIQVEQGKIHYKDGRTYIGEIQNSQPSGFGKLNLSLDMVYEGEFSEGKYHGFGQIFDVKRSVLKQGQFKNGKMDGPGIFQKEGLKVSGLWEDDKMVLISSSDYNMILNDWRVKQVVSPVKFNEIEYVPTKHGNCEIVFKSLYDGSTSRRRSMCQELLFAILKSVLSPKQTADMLHTICFQITLESVVQYLNCFLGEAFKPDFRAIVETALKSLRQSFIIKQKESNGVLPTDKLEAHEERALEKDASRAVDGVYKHSQKLVLGIVQACLERLPKELTKEVEASLVGLIKQVVAQGMFDDRLQANRQDLVDKLISDLSKENFRKVGTELDRKFKADMGHGTKGGMAGIAKKIRGDKFLTTGKSMQSEARSSNMNSQIEEEVSRLPQLQTSSGLRMFKQGTLKSGEDLSNDYAEINTICFSPAVIASWDKLIGLVLNTLDQIDESIPDLFQGQMYDDEVSGFGVIFKQGQEVYRGEFKDNKALGVGQLAIDRHCFYRGMVDKLVPQSYGILIRGDLAQKALFVHGKKTGVVIKTKASKTPQRTGKSQGHVAERVIAVTQYSESGEKDGVSVSLVAEGEVLAVYQEGTLQVYRVLPRGTFSIFRPFTRS